MDKKIQFGVFFSKKEIDMDWGKPKLSKRQVYPFISISIPEDKEEDLLGLRVYAKVVGYMCDGKREMLAVEFASGNHEFNDITSTPSGKQYLEISRSASSGRWKMDYSRFMPIYKEKPIFLHGFVGAFVGNQLVDDFNELNYILDNAE